jgi:heme exporter protein B
MGQLPSWIGLLAGFDVVYWGLGVVLFPRVIEE